MSDAVIKIENLSKRFRLGEMERYRTLRDSLTRWGRRLIGRGGGNVNGADGGGGRKHANEFWALKDVSFEVNRGDVVGIIGRNGAGKSTLLKILSRITEPTTGRAELTGRVGSLLEVGTGFHPELTGRENVYLNGAILGMSTSEIRRKFDDIVAFSGIERFLDTPVKRYSSGMHVRLGFAIAAHLEPEILVVDEVLAVGDQEFQNRCIGKMKDVATSGRTVLFVSHNMAAVESLCTRGVLLERGEVAFVGDVEDVIRKYTFAGVDGLPDFDLTALPERARSSRPPVFRRLRLTDVAGQTVPAVQLGSDVVFEVTLHAAAPIHHAAIVVAVQGPIGERLFNLHSGFQHDDDVTLHGEVVARCTLRNCRLTPGPYQMSLLLKSGWETVEGINSAALGFHVTPADVYGTGRIMPAQQGPFVPEAEWEVGGTAGVEPDDLEVVRR